MLLNELIVALNDMPSLINKSLIPKNKADIKGKSQ